MKTLFFITSILFISCSTQTGIKTYCSEGVVWKDSLRIYYSELNEIEDLSFNVNKPNGNHYMAEISKCQGGFCIESIKQVKINAHSKWFQVIDGCQY